MLGDCDCDNNNDCGLSIVMYVVAGTANKVQCSSIYSTMIHIQSHDFHMSFTAPSPHCDSK